MHQREKLLAYFRAQRVLGKTFQHPGGKLATELLLRLVPQLPDNPSVLELGCGAGMTAGVLLERFRCRYVGIDISPDMLTQTQRVLSRVSAEFSLVRADLSHASLPFGASSFDLVLAESVIAILDAPGIVGECHRILKTGGVLAWNDRIWGSALSGAEQATLNEASLNVTGFRAASSETATAERCREILSANGFELLASEQLHGAPAAVDGEWGHVVRRLNTAFRAVRHPTLLPLWMREKRMALSYAALWRRMENWLFTARKR